MPNSQVKERDIIFINHRSIQGDHFHIIVKIIGDDIYTVCCTSQIQNLERLAELYGWYQQFVPINHKSTSNMLFKETAASCNDCFEFCMAQILCGRHSGEVTEHEYEQIIQGMKNSPKLKNKYKKLLI